MMTPSKSVFRGQNIAKIRDVIRADQSLKARAEADLVNLNRETVRRILTDELIAKSICMKAVSKVLSDDQKQYRKDVRVDMFEHIDGETNLLKLDITCENTWKFTHELKVNRFLATKNIPVAPQPPYMTDLSPCDFFLFSKLKNHLKGHHFGTLENVQTAVTDQLKVISISEFHQCYEEWKKLHQRCVASEDSYFE
ncbi:putative transposase [Trichonephila clavipes]|nr:putative transposase [Trichonephila clavipes]